MKAIITSVLIWLCAILAYGQENKTTYYLNDKGKQVENADSAKAIRTVSNTKNNEGLYDVVEYDTKKRVRRIGNSLTKTVNPSYNGIVITFYGNGEKESEVAYVSGHKEGLATYYHSNKTVAKKVRNEMVDKKVKTIVLEINDDTGKALLDKNGTGVYEYKDKKGRLCREEYLNGIKHGEWRSYNTADDEVYISEYNEGKFVKGKTIEPSGKVVEYDVEEKLPAFPGGTPAFGRFVGKNMRYPAEAKQKNIQGRVFISFVVEKDGAITDAKVLRGIGGGCDEEALRVINLSPKWEPGIQRGKAVRVSYTIPLFFQLQQQTTPNRSKSRFDNF